MPCGDTHAAVTRQRRGASSCVKSSFTMISRCPVRVSAAIAVLALLLSAAPAGAEDLFEFLFGKVERQPELSKGADAPPVSRPLSLTIRARLSTPGPGRGTAFCVRVCDGRYFPIQRTANAQPG